MIPLALFLFSCQKQKSDLEILKQNSCLPLGLKLDSAINDLDYEEKRDDGIHAYSIKAEKLYEGNKTYIYFDDAGTCVGLFTRNPFYGFNVFGIGIYDSFYSHWHSQKNEDNGWHILVKYNYYEWPLDNVKNKEGEVWYGATNLDGAIELRFSVDFSGEEYDESMGCVRALEVIISK